jgi:hypothetical protein
MKMIDPFQPFAGRFPGEFLDELIYKKDIGSIISI